MLSIDKTLTKILLLEDTKAIDENLFKPMAIFFFIVKRFDEKVNRILNGSEEVYI
jgi:hypothetical protein